MVDGRFSVLVAEFEDEESSLLALKNIHDQQNSRAIMIQDAAVIHKGLDGKIQVQDSTDVSAANGAGIGLLAGAAIGLIGGPAGIGTRSVTGAAAGVIAARLHNSGIRNDQLRQVGEELTPGSSALVLVIDPQWTTAMEKDLVASGARVFTTGIAAEIAAQIQKTALEAELGHDGH
jgi:uncharacterized membrane protein